PGSDRRLQLERRTLSEVPVGVVVRGEQGVHAVREVTSRYERVGIVELTVTRDREPPARSIAHEGYPAGEPLVAEAVAQRAVHVGEADRHAQPVAESEREPLHPVVAERVGDALEADAARSL